MDQINCNFIYSRLTYGDILRTRRSLISESDRTKIIKYQSENQNFTIKWIPKDQEPYSIREIAIMTQLKHPNVIRLLDIATFTRYIETDNHIGAVMPSAICDVASIRYMSINIHELIRNKYNYRTNSYEISAAVAFYISQCMMAGIAYIHSLFILHGDIKTDNLLIFSDGCVKIADFGLSYSILYDKVDKDQKMYALMCRPPEIIWTKYTKKSLVSDVWAAGCTIWEIYTGKQLFVGKNQTEVLLDIFKMLGTPKDSQICWLSIERPPNWADITSKNNSPYYFIFQNSKIPKYAAELVLSMLDYNIATRITSYNAYIKLSSNIFNGDHINYSCVKPRNLMNLLHIRSIVPSLCNNCLNFTHLMSILKIALLLDINCPYANVEIYILAVKYISLLLSTGIDNNKLCLIYYGCLYVASEVVTNMSLHSTYSDIAVYSIFPEINGDDIVQLDQIKQIILYKLRYDVLIATEIHYLRWKYNDPKRGITRLEYNENLCIFILMTFVVGTQNLSPKTSFKIALSITKPELHLCVRPKYQSYISDLLLYLKNPADILDMETIHLIESMLKVDMFQLIHK